MSASETVHFTPVRVTHAQVLRLALPFTLANLSTPLLGFADAAVIGRLGAAHLLGAIAAAAVIFDFTFWGFSFLRIGTAGLTAQAVGCGDLVEQKATLLRALASAACIGLLLIALQAPIATIGFAAFGASPEVTEAAKAYFNIRIWSAPFVFANYVVLGTVTGRARTDIALGLQVFINLFNIALNVWFVYGFGLGVRGSAAGTLIAEASGMLIGLAILNRLEGGIFGLAWRRVFDKAKLLRLVAINRDIMIRTASLTFAFAFFTSQGARGGDITLAANAVLFNIFFLTAYFLDGFAAAAQQMCGQSVGARDADGFRSAVRVTMIWSLAFAGSVTLLAFLTGPLIIDFLSTNETVRAMARHYLAFAALTPLCGAMAFEFDGVFIGATWTQAMRNTMLAALVLFIGMFFLLKPFGNTGLWSAWLVFLIARGVGQAILYPRSLAKTFPAAQSAAAAPVASAS
ncbi:MAG: MATE family efflux transporter [Methylovirgula sp.]